MRLLICLILLLSVFTTVIGQEAYFVEAGVDNSSPFAGQQIVYTLRFYADRVSPHEVIEPDFAGWWRGEQTASASAEVMDDMLYNITVYETLLYPIQSGTLTIAPSRIVIPETVFSEQVAVAAPPVTLQVQPLPENAPPEFNGAVGRFDAEITLDKQTVILGEPVTLRYRINGSGNVAQMTPPPLNLPAGWRAYPNPTTSSIQTRGVGERIFEWRLIPQTAGSQVLPANTFAYFDPDSAVYRSITLPEFTVDVLPGEDGLRELPTFERGANAPAALDIKPVPALLTIQNEAINGWMWMIAPFGAVLIWGGVQFNTRRKAYKVLRRQAAALKTAARHLQAAQDYRQIQESIESYFADKVNHHQPYMTWGEIEAVLKQKAPSALPGILQLLQRAEDGRYAPTGVIHLNELITHTLEALTTVDQIWRD